MLHALCQSRAIALPWAWVKKEKCERVEIDPLKDLQVETIVVVGFLPVGP